MESINYTTHTHNSVGFYWVYRAISGFTLIPIPKPGMPSSRPEPEPNLGWAGSGWAIPGPKAMPISFSAGGTRYSRPSSSLQAHLPATITLAATALIQGNDCRCALAEDCCDVFCAVGYHGRLYYDKVGIIDACGISLPGTWLVDPSMHRGLT